MRPKPATRCTLNQKERKILEIDESFRRRMGVKIAPPHNLKMIRCNFFGPSHQHDPRAFQGIAVSTFVEHQRDASVGENVFGVHGEPRNQQDRRPVGVAGDVDQGTIRVSTTGHQGRQCPLPALPQQ